MFGGVERGSGRAFLALVARRDAATLTNLITQHILPFTTIYSDSWRAYSNLTMLPQAYTHLMVNHQINFVNPLNGAHTQHIESLWQKYKNVAKRKFGINNRRYTDYMSEFLWRKQFGNPNEVMYNLWDQIARLYVCI